MYNTKTKKEKKNIEKEQKSKLYSNIVHKFDCFFFIDNYYADPNTKYS